MKHIGMDVHSTTTQVSVLSDRGRILKSARILTQESNLVEFLMGMPGPKRVALEESQMADFVTRIIEPHVTEVIRCLPQHNRLISESEKKLDREDARILAELLYLNKLKAVHHPTWQYRQLRQGVCAYWKASQELTRIKNRLKAFYLFSGVHCAGKKVYAKRYRDAWMKKVEERSGNLDLLEQHYEQLDFFRKNKATHVKILKELAQPLRQDVRLLMTYPGIGFIGACTLVAYLEKGWRIKNKRQLWQYSGVGMRIHESNYKGRRGASHQGNRYLKNALLTAVASLASRRNADNALTRMWRAGVEAGIDPARMKRNLARKVVVIAQRALRFHEEYDDDRVVTTQ